MGELKKILRKLKRNKRYIFLFFLVAAFYLSILFLFKYFDIQQEDIKKLIDPLGVYGVIILFLLQLFFSLTPLPDGTMPIIATITYGWQGFLIILLGMLTGSLIHFYIAKKLGKSVIEKKYPLIKRYSDKAKGGNEIVKLIYIRMFSIISFDVAAYVAGISGIKFSTFLISAILGLIPTNAMLMIASSGLFAQSYLDYLNIGFWLLLSSSVLAFWYKQSKINNN